MNKNTVAETKKNLGEIHNVDCFLEKSTALSQFKKNR